MFEDFIFFEYEPREVVVPVELYTVFWPRKPDLARNPADNLDNLSSLISLVFLCFEGSGGEIYTVFDKESESGVENPGFLHPDLEIQKIQKKY